MLLLLFVLLLVVPVAELWVILQVAGGLGIVPTVALLLGVSVLGAWFVRREGTGVLRRLSSATSRGELPTDELVEGAVVLVGGLLLLTPGFLTDLLGLALLVGPVRVGVRRLVVARTRRRLLAGAASAAGFGGPMAAGRSSHRSGRAWRVDVGRAWIDADAHDAPPGGVLGRGAGSGS